MNFKKYHVSRNLFDKDNATLYNLFPGTENKIKTSSNARSIAILCDGGETYTVSKKAGLRFMVCFTTEPIATQVAYTNLTTDNTAESITVVAPLDAKYLFVYFYNSTADVDTVETLVNSIMINTGSTALPYEPYSSEVWHDIPHYIHNTSTDTITTLPADIYPNDTTATVGLKGNMSQTGTPSPTTPIQPSETGERTGNLFDESNFALIQVTTTAYRYGTSLGVLSQGTYTFNATKSAGAQSIYLTEKLNGVYLQTTISSVPFSFTADGESEYIIRTANNTGTTWEAEKYSDIMLNTGSTALPYEPYGYKLDISSASTTTPVYLGEVETTRKIKKLVLDGTENWAKSSAQTGRYNLAVSDYLKAKGEITSICTHFAAVAQQTGGQYSDKSQSFYAGSDATRFMFLHDASIETLADFKAYLAAQYANGTPVCVWYVLATPETAVVNEPLRKIGDYADEVSNVSIPVTAGGDTLSVDTTLQPSEMSATYKGWHPVQSVHEKSKNLFDDWYETGVLVDGGGVDSSSSYVNYRTTDFIPVDTNTYTFSLDNTFYSQSTATSSRAAYYDENENFISISFFYNRPERFEQIISVPNNAKYIRLTGRITDENIMLNSGSTALPYEPYWT